MPWRWSLAAGRHRRDSWRFCLCEDLAGSQAAVHDSESSAAPPLLRLSPFPDNIDPKAVPVGIVALSVVSHVQWGVYMVVCTKFRPLKRVLVNPSLPDAVRTFVKKTEVSVDQTANRLWGFLHKVPGISRFPLPRQVPQAVSLGMLEGTVLWSATYPLSLPVFIFFLVEGFRRAGWVVNRPEEDDFESRLAAEMQNTSYREWTAQGFDPAPRSS